MSFFEPLNSAYLTMFDVDDGIVLQLEPGESRDIYMPVVPTKWNNDRVDVTISATSYLASDVVTKTLFIKVLSCSPVIVNL